MSFDDVNVEADQEFEIMRDNSGTLEYPFKFVYNFCHPFGKFIICFSFQNRIVKFSNVFHLTIHIPRNYGEDNTKVYYIGLRGEFQKVSQVLSKMSTI